MEIILRYLLLLFICYFGLGVGAVIAHYVEEELKPGRKYFKVLKIFVFSTVVFYLLSYLKFGLDISIPTTLIMTLIVLLWDFRMKFINTGMVFYSFFAVVLFETKTSNYSAIFATLIFIFGLASAAEKIEKKGKSSVFLKLKTVLLENVLFLILGILLLIIFKS